jgi:hypothetical protein
MNQPVIVQTPGSGTAIFCPEGTELAYTESGQLIHKIMKVPDAIGGDPYPVWRALATSLEEAREKRIDFWHPTLGLIWNGYKLARDRSIADIMSDNSVGGLVPRGELPVESAGFQEK